MTRIKFEEPMNKAWRDWKEECEVAREELIREVKVGNDPRISNLYKDNRLTGVYKAAGQPFHGKCAYCESNVLVNQFGDIDHWRPKSALMDKDGRPVISDIRNDQTGHVRPRVHSGYYWLAYDWRNLLLSCEICNRVVRVNGHRIGKGAQFPVVDFRAFEPGEEVNEQPLLINPMFEDPREHLEIRQKNGLIIPKTERGQATIDVFGLNFREQLVMERRRCIRNTRDLICLLNMARRANDPDRAKCIMDRVHEIESGCVPFSAAARAVLEECDVL